MDGGPRSPRTNAERADSDSEHDLLTGEHTGDAENEMSNQTSDEDDNHWKDHDTAWKYVALKRHQDLVFFDTLNIAKDGGLVEITGTKDDRDQLWYSSRYFSAFVLVSFVFLNIVCILQVDLAALRTEQLSETMTDEERVEACGTKGSGGVCGHNYLLTAGILTGVNRFCHHWFSHSFSMTPVQFICGAEMWILFALIVQIIFRITQVIGIKYVWVRLGYVTDHTTLRMWERRRWFAAAQLFWGLIPQASIYSAMKLLFYVTPQVLSLHLNTILFYEEDKMVLRLCWFVFSRAGCAVIGFDSFLVKYRTASAYIMTDHSTFSNVLGAILLLNQIVGVVQISWVIRERLFRFVFGGEDGIMSVEENVKMDTWNALVARKVWRRYPNIFDRLTLLLTFNDDDFQRMCLSEGKEIDVKTPKSMKY